MIRLLRWLLSRLGRRPRILAFPVPRALARPRRRLAIGRLAASVAERVLERKRREDH